ncbi:hypothetical protein GCM10007173_13620 [Glutamicibacter ardleyensis]|uniref:Uncharacterized protein n=1 Tax=Glutamicibacter ardleyensis TaxID=225894 RepID=A0ABQ2DFV3_9MICC|nr:hypothetical protein GCM10007173_13620 [Glutamicibacter ardleyensis]
MITHYAVISFSGDPTGEHGDGSLNGQPPSLSLIAAGNEKFCWEALTRWTGKQPLRMREHAEVLARTNQGDINGNV